MTPCRLNCGGQQHPDVFCCPGCWKRLSRPQRNRVVDAGLNYRRGKLGQLTWLRAWAEVAREVREGRVTA